ncbi:hypothetical protein ACH5RR_024351 [Cinchona calisaya]|uniref:C3H1-type domain-containing protein n=1 Tax=Cinchona calisaya TaxID=153742 RepID=A0ABD2YWD7_9GENT
MVRDRQRDGEPKPKANRQCIHGVQCRRRNCKFTHFPEDIEPEDPSVDLIPRDCKHVTRGNCPRGRACWDIHIDDPPGPTPAYGTGVRPQHQSPAYGTCVRPQHQRPAYGTSVRPQHQRPTYGTPAGYPNPRHHQAIGPLPAGFFPAYPPNWPFVAHPQHQGFYHQFPAYGHLNAVGGLPAYTWPFVAHQPVFAPALPPPQPLGIHTHYRPENRIDVPFHQPARFFQQFPPAAAYGHLNVGPPAYVPAALPPPPP